VFATHFSAEEIATPFEGLLKNLEEKTRTVVTA
jgi:hypothetical protein